MIEALIEQETYTELAARKRAELEMSIKGGQLADPISLTIGGVLTSLAVSASVAAASYLISKAFAPKPPKQSIGKLSGSLQLQNSEQGIFIPEIYGAGPIVSLVTGANPTYQNLANVTSGAGGSLTKTSGGNAWNAGASHNVAVTSGVDAFLLVTLGAGYACAGFTTTASPVSGNADFLYGIQWNPDGSITIKYSNTLLVAGVTHWTVGDVFRIELRGGRFRLYKGTAEIVPADFVPPTPSYPCYLGIAIQNVGSGVSAAKAQVGSIGLGPNQGRGGVKIPAIIVWSTGIRKVVTTTTQQTQGGKGLGGGHGTPVETTTYFIDIALMGGRGPLNLLREYANADVLIDQVTQSLLISGVYNPVVGADTTYDPLAPPDPQLNYRNPIDRADANIVRDSDRVGTGAILSGSTTFAIYPGNTTQQPDPTIESDIDGKYGAGSTPAFHNHSMVVHPNFPLSRWGGIVPNFTFVWEHQTLKTLDTIFASMCERVNLIGGATAITPANVSGGTFSAGTFTKTSTDATWGNSGFSSVQSIAGDGYIEWVVTETNKYRMVGLSTTDPDTNYTSIQYAWYMVNDSTHEIYESGTPRLVLGPLVANTTVLRIQRVGTTLTYYKDGVSQRIVTGVTTSPLFLDVAVFNIGATIPPVTMSGVGVGGDYNFSGVSTIASRGMLIAGRLYAPAEVIGSADIEITYNYFVTEAEAQIVGYAEGTEPSITISDTEVGWMDGDSEIPDIIPEVESILASELLLARQVDVKYIDPDSEWEPNTQHAIRQITDGVSTELLEVQLTLLADEARAVAQRKLYRDYVGGTAHKFTLPWTYLYIYPGYKIIINRAEGFTHTIRLTSLSGGIGVLECEGVAIAPEVWNQPATGGFPPGYIPPQQVPAMTIVQLMDTPLLRDGDETNNYGIGFYMAGVPRTSINQNWQGFALYISRSNVWTILESENLPATVGTIVSATGLSSDTSVIDRTGIFTVDLYGTTAILTSITEDTLRTVSGINLALVGSMVIQFATATQVAGFPNRWDITTLLNGRRGTEDHISDTFTNQRFVLIDGAVKFVPMVVADIGNNASYRAVTSGQSLSDAATVSFAWNAEALRPLSPVNLRGTRDTALNLLIEWTRRSRLGAGMIPGSDVPIGEEQETYDVEILNGSNVVLRTMRVFVGSSRPAVLVPNYGAAFVSANNILPDAAGNGATAYATQKLENSGDYVEASLFGPTGSNYGAVGFINPNLVSRLGFDFSGYANLHRFVVTFTRDPFSATPGLFVSDTPNIVPGTVVYSSGLPAIGSAQAARVRIMLSGSEVRCYWDYTGPASVPFYVMPVGPGIPVTPTFFTVGTGGEVRNAVIGQTGVASVVYSLAQQIADFGSAQSSIRVRVTQVSRIVGRGRYVQGQL